MSVHQSKWGFHPTSYETSKKLRFINKVFALARRNAGSWQRWERKDPHNRVHKNRKTGEIISLNEPVVCELFHEKIPTRRSSYSNCKILPNCFSNGLGEHILELSRQARIPVANASDVKPLDFDDAKINFYFDLAKDWYESVCLEESKC
jgi:hypothetical protein